MKHFFRCFLLTVILGFTAGIAHAFDPDLAKENDRQNGELIVAVSDTFDWPATVSFLQETQRSLESRYPDIRIRFVKMDSETMRHSLFLHQIDFFISSSGFYAYASTMGGAHYIATMKLPHMSSARQGMGALYFTRAANTRLETLPDMRSQRVAAISESDFYSWYITLNAVANQTRYPFNWFGKSYFPGSDRAVVDMVLNGQVEVGILPSCQLELLIQQGYLSADAVRPINPIQHKDFGCRVSTPLFTGPILGAASHVSEADRTAISRSVFSVDNSPSGYEWVISNDLRNEMHVLSAFEGAAFRSGDSNINKTYEKAAAIGTIILMLAILYAAIIRKSVADASKELGKAQNEKAHLERAGVVSGLSMLIAHEIRQPLTSITTYAEGLQFYLDDQKDDIITEATTGIQREAKRVSDIVERVRQYAKNQQRPHVKMNIALLVTRARRSVANSIPAADKIRFRLPPDAEIICEPIEIELLLANLMKNALQAVDPETGAVNVVVTPHDDDWEIAVEDNGLPISDEIFEHLTHPVTSQKIEGLGLGLSICRSIVLKHDGVLTYERRSPRGLRAIVRLPKAPVGHATDPYDLEYSDQ